VKRAILVICLTPGLGACLLWGTSRIDAARKGFKYTFYCPDDRIQARRREDLRPSDARRRERAAADVAADPERLRMWRREQREDSAQEDSRSEIYEVSGCGHEELYECYATKGGVSCPEFQIRDDDDDR
jgi:hypothetical protein